MKIPDHNIFMMCQKINKDAFTPLPKEFYIRTLRKDELDLWKGFPFDTNEDKIKYYDYMTNYFNQVYTDAFFHQCKVICHQDDQPIATAFIWKAYGSFTTIHWVKVLKEYEGHGIGRALLSEILKSLDSSQFPIYLHTQTTSYRAIKLYSDFGFMILTDDVIGLRKNEYKQALPYLKQLMPQNIFENLTYTTSDGELSKVASLYPFDAF